MAQPPEKSEGAFRTIREVADWLAVPTHVLRFWESKFDMIAPVKGAGGRRYYRPEDMRLLGGIKVLLHDQGLTIRGVLQRIETEGLEPVMALSPDLDASEQPSQRARRVIRSDDEEAPRVVPFHARPDGRSGASAIDSGGGPDEVEESGQPAEDPIPTQPVDTPAPPQPDDHGLREPRMPRQPVDDGPERTAHAPAVPMRRPEFDEGGDDMPDVAIEDQDDEDPLEEGQPVDLPDPNDDATQLGDRSDDEEPVFGHRPTMAPPPHPAFAVKATRPLEPGARRRLRRVLHRLRGLIADLEDDLAARKER